MSPAKGKGQRGGKSPKEHLCVPRVYMEATKDGACIKDILAYHAATKVDQSTATPKGTSRAPKDVPFQVWLLSTHPFLEKSSGNTTVNIKSF